MYAPRQSADLSKMAGVIAGNGIVVTDDIYSVSELAEINAAMDPLFKSKLQEKRAYVMPDEMLAAGILDKVLSKKMFNTILSIMPDPVLYHFHAYEIAANSNQSHIFADTLGGWHRDPDSEFHSGDPTHISIFVYLSNVGERDLDSQVGFNQLCELLEAVAEASVGIVGAGCRLVLRGIG